MHIFSLFLKFNNIKKTKGVNENKADGENL